jgi:hypothetical protein
MGREGMGKGFRVESVGGVFFIGLVFFPLDVFRMTLHSIRDAYILGLVTPSLGEVSSLGEI